MSLGIPLPGDFGHAFGQGLDTGSTLFSRIMQPKLQREGDQRQWAQHQQSIAQQEAQRQQAWQQHLQELAIRQAQEQRLAQMTPYQIQAIEAQIGHHNAQSQGLAFDQNLLQQLLGNQNGNQMQPFMNMPNEQEGTPSQFNPSSGMETQMGQQGTQNIGDNPILAGLLKKRLGIDVNAESPGMKSNRALEDFIKREQYKQNQPKEMLTPGVASKVQEEIFNIQKVKPELDQLIALEPQTFTFLGTTNDANYNALTFRLADSLVKALNYPQTNESIKKMQDSLKIGKTESREYYQKRLQRLKNDLEEREIKGLELLGGKRVSPTNESTMIKGILNGKEVSIHPSRRKQFEERGGQIL